MRYANGLIWYVFGLGLGLRIIYATYNPIFRAPDEQAHFAYITHLANELTLPTLPPAQPNVFPGSENNQPPLYYSLLVPFYWGTNKLGVDTGTQVVVLRICSVLLFWVPSFWFGWLAVYRIPVPGWMLWGNVTVLGLLPGYLALTASINNDQALFLAAHLVLYLLTEPKPNFLLIAIVLGLGFCVKLSAILIAFALACYFLIQVIVSPYPTVRTIIRNALPVTLIPSLVVGLWMVRSAWLYGNPIRAWVFYEQYAAHRNSVWEGLYDAQTMLKATFWATAGQFNDLQFLPKFHLYLTYAAIVGLLVFVFKQRCYKRQIILHTLTTKPVLSAWIMAAVLNLIIVLQHGYSYYMSQGRYLYPMIIPIFWCIFAGWQQIYRLLKLPQLPALISGWALVLLFSVDATFFIIFLLSQD